MKKIYNIVIVVGLIGLFLSSCELERFPYNKIERSQSFKTLKDAKSWDNGIYAYFRGRQYGIYTMTQDMQADQLNATLAYGNRYGLVHKWTGFLADSYYIRDTWAGYYSGITNANVIIDGLSKMKLEGEEQAKLEQYLGDAYFVRAYYYHQLVLRWAKAYDPATATTDLGVPVVLVYDVNALPSRATVQEVYEQILADIAEAKTRLAGITGEPGATRFNIDVVTALEARVKFYMKDWAGAYQAATSLIDGGKYALINSEDELRKMWVNDMPQEVIYQCFVQKPDELAKTNSEYLGFQPKENNYSPSYIPEGWMIDLYEDADIRKAVYFANLPVVVDGQNYTDIKLMNKYPGNPELFTGANTNYQQAPKVFRVAEMYLIAAEAAAVSGNGDALKYLNDLRMARGVAAVASSGAQLLKDVKDERTRELAYEGFRLFDLKRWGEGFTRRNPQNVAPLVPGEGFLSLSVPAGDDKFVWGLPSRDITVNPNLVQNPGW